MGDDLRLAGFDGDDEWDTCINMFTANWSHGLRPLAIGGNDKCPGANKSLRPPTVTAKELSNIGIANWLNQMAKHGEDQDASDRSQFRALASGRGLPTIHLATWEDIVARAPNLFASTTLSTTRNSDNAKLRCVRGLLMKAFGKKPTKQSIAAMLQEIPLDFTDDNSLALLFMVYEQKIRSLGQSAANTIETSIEMFDQRLEKEHPTIHASLRELYIRDIQTREPDAMEALSDPSHLDPNTYRRVLKQMRTRVKLLPTTASLSPPKPRASDWMGEGESPSHRRPQQHYEPLMGMSTTITEEPDGRTTRDWQDDEDPPPQPDTELYVNAAYQARRMGFQPREMDLTLKLATADQVKCPGCGCNHPLSDCNYIDHRPNKEGLDIQPWIHGAALVYMKGEATWKRMKEHMRKHGFMQKWSQANIDRFERDVEWRAAKLSKDPSEGDYQRQIERYGTQKVPPIMRRPDNNPAWRTSN